jgi:flagellin
MVAAGNFKVRQMEITKKIQSIEIETTRLGAREGGLSVVQDMLLELQGLVVQGANTGGLGEGELDSIITQAQGIVEGINFVTQSTMFNGEQILIDSTADRLGSVNVDGERRGMADLAMLLKEDPEAAQKLVDGAVDRVSGRRAAIGIRMNEIETDMRVLQEEFAGNAGILSQIEDADYAKETADLVRSQILEQATIKGILIERENAERVLDLISGVRPPASRV